MRGDLSTKKKHKGQDLNIILKGLKKCIFVGTSSLRRSAQLKLNFPQLKFQVSIPLNTIIFEGLHFGLGYGLVWSMI